MVAKLAGYKVQLCNTDSAVFKSVEEDFGSSKLTLCDELAEVILVRALFPSPITPTVGPYNVFHGSIAVNFPRVSDPDATIGKS